MCFEHYTRKIASLYRECLIHFPVEMRRLVHSPVGMLLIDWFPCQEPPDSFSCWNASKCNWFSQTAKHASFQRERDFTILTLVDTNSTDVKKNSGGARGARGKGFQERGWVRGGGQGGRRRSRGGKQGCRRRRQGGSRPDRRNLFPHQPDRLSRSRRLLLGGAFSVIFSACSDGCCLVVNSLRRKSNLPWFLRLFYFSCCWVNTCQWSLRLRAVFFFHLPHFRYMNNVLLVCNFTLCIFFTASTTRDVAVFSSLRTENKI